VGSYQAAFHLHQLKIMPYHHFASIIIA
jgi:hypothetical protein